MLGDVAWSKDRSTLTVCQSTGWSLGFRLNRIIVTAISIAVLLSLTYEAVQAHLLKASNRDFESTAARNGKRPAGAPKF